nr:hypothetical protein CFP56_20087 [Quercus suber]
MGRILSPNTGTSLETESGLKRKTEILMSEITDLVARENKLKVDEESENPRVEGCGATPPSPLNLLSWNCRGFGNLRIVKALENVVNKEEPIIVYLMEAKLNRDWMEKVKEKCNLKHGLIVPSNGNSGGLAMMWKEGVKLEV